MEHPVDGERERFAHLDAKADRTVPGLFDDATLARWLDEITPPDDEQFAAELVDRELELIASGGHPDQIYLRIAVLQTTRDTLQLLRTIRSLPEWSPRTVASDASAP